MQLNASKSSIILVNGMTVDSKMSKLQDLVCTLTQFLVKSAKNHVYKSSFKTQLPSKGKILDESELHLLFPTSFSFLFSFLGCWWWKSTFALHTKHPICCPCSTMWAVFVWKWSFHQGHTKDSFTIPYRKKTEI